MDTSDFAKRIFQSTLPRRERPWPGSKGYSARADFNPRSRGGSDSANYRNWKKNGGFQSTLPRRERLWRFWQIVSDDWFQSTLPRRERLAAQFICTSISEFQSTLPRRERLKMPWIHSIIFIFQSTLPRRERRRKAKSSAYMQPISIHAPAEGATANIHNFFGVISEQNVHICIFSYIISFSRRINNHINKEINEFSGANRLGIYGCFIFARIFMKFLITAPLYKFFIKKYRIGLSDV